MLQIGITGGIGSGKSTVCKIFSTLGIPVFDADKEAKLLYHREDVKVKVMKLFGEDVYPAGNFDRKKLAALVFPFPEKLLQLNQLIHPLVQQNFISWQSQQESPYVIKEAALLIESGSYKYLNEMILVTCPIEQRIERVMNRDHITKAEVLERLNKQLSDDEKKVFCQHEIVNDGLQLLIPQVLELDKKWRH